MNGLYALAGIVEPVCRWFEENKRSMPWRQDPSPYHVWISEIMLQQTRIEAVKAYYDRFTARLPDVESLAGVEEDELMKLWEGLGYYNRAGNLKKAALLIMEKYGGELPADYGLLMELPGIGSYTAGAVASIAFGLRAPAVDGNVLRVAMRYLDCRDDITSMAVRKKMERSVMAVIPDDHPGEFNQGLMELGETVCIPNGTPLCGDCPIQGQCAAHAGNHEQDLPVKKKKRARRVESRTVLILKKGREYGIVKRPERGLLAGLWEFPSLGGKKSLPQMREWLQGQGVSFETLQRFGRAKHIFSHVEWHMTGYRITLPEGVSQDIVPGVVWADVPELLGRYAVPTAFRFFLEQIQTLDALDNSHS